MHSGIAQHFFLDAGLMCATSARGRLEFIEYIVIQRGLQLESMPSGISCKSPPRAVQAAMRAVAFSSDG